MISKRKRIILIDLDCQLIYSLYRSKDLIIDTLIVSTDQQIKEMKEKFDIENVFSMESINYFYNIQKVDLDYSIIKLFRNTQLKVEHFFSRVAVDISTIQYTYYNALSYWFSKFKENNFDAVISAGIEFGSTFDSIIYDVANYYDKKVFIMEVALNNGRIIANQIFDYNKKKYIKIDPLQNGLKCICRKDFLYNSNVKIATKNDLTFKGIIKNLLEKYGGFLLVTFVVLLLGKFKSIHHTFNVNWWTYFKNYIHTKKMLKYYDSLSVNYDHSKKYIYYALHMEPEAATLARTTFSNQLIIIKTLSNCLPDGWSLFVKEHPHQFTKMNTSERYYFLASLDKFKTKRFYSEIAKLPNTKLLKINSNNNSIIKNAQAISTINGTVILESIEINKPVVLFSQGTTPFSLVSDIFDISTTLECKEALDKIDKSFVPNYNNYKDMISNYFFEVENNKDTDYSIIIKKLIFNYN